MIIAENLAETNAVPMDVAVRQPFLYAILATAENHQQELAQCNDKKAKKAFIEGCGGANKVHPFQNFRTFWESLTIELRTKITNIPSGVIQQKEWFALAKLTIEQVTKWCQRVLNGSKIISPKAWIKEISNFIPNSFPKKSSLKLGEPLENEDFKVLLSKKAYDFTPENLESFIAQVRSETRGKPLVTEDVLPFLKDRGLNPLLILSKEDRIRFDYEIQLLQKDKELEAVRSQFKELEQKLHQRDQRIEQLEQQNQQQQVQINQLTEQNRQVFEQMQEFKQFMESSKAAA